MFEDGNAHNQRRTGGISLHPLPLPACVHGEGPAEPPEGRLNTCYDIASLPGKDAIMFLINVYGLNNAYRR